MYVCLYDCICIIRCRAISASVVSGAMALPFSSFPNVNSLLVVDDFQRPYLSVQDFIVTGLPMSVITVLLIASIGFVLISVLLVTPAGAM